MARQHAHRMTPFSLNTIITKSAQLQKIIVALATITVFVIICVFVSFQFYFSCADTVTALRLLVSYLQRQRRQRRSWMSWRRSCGTWIQRIAISTHPTSASGFRTGVVNTDNIWHRYPPHQLQPLALDTLGLGLFVQLPASSVRPVETVWWMPSWGWPDTVACRLILPTRCLVIHCRTLTRDNNRLQVSPWSPSIRADVRLRNNLYSVEWGVKLYLRAEVQRQPKVV